MLGKFRKLIQNPVIALSPFYIWLLVDTLNGLLLRSVELPITISNVFKAVVLLLAFFTIRDKKHMLLAAFSMGVIILISIVHLFNPLTASSGMFTSLYQDLLAGIKLVSPIVFTLSFLSVLNNKQFPISKSHVRLILLVNLGVIVINLIISLLGFGYSQYKAGIGAKGFFLSGNELAITFLTISSAVIYFKRNHRSIVFLTFLALMVVFGLIIGTKVAIFGTVAVVAVVSLLLRYNFVERVLARQKLIKLNYIWFGLLAVVTVIGGVLIWKLPYTHSAVARWSAMIDYANNPISGLLSQRDVLAGSAFKYIEEQFTLTDYIFGIGFNNITEAMNQYPPYRAGITELDGVDLFMYIGVLSFLYYGLWIYMLVKMVARKTLKSAGVFAFTINLLLFAISTFSGHTVFSAINAPFWGIINAIGLSQIPMRIKWPTFVITLRAKVIKCFRHLVTTKIVYVLPAFFFLASDTISTLLRTTSQPTITVSLILKGISIALLYPLLSRRTRIYTFLAIATIVFLTCVHVFNPLTSTIGLKRLVFGDLQFGLKVLLPFVFAFAFFGLGKTLDPNRYKRLVLLIFAVNFLVILLNELIGALRLYGLEALSFSSLISGSKGLLFSWNEFAIGYVTISSYLLYRFRNKHPLVMLSMAILMIFGTFLAFKKVSVFGTLFFVSLILVFFRHDFWFNLFRKQASHVVRYFVWLAVLAGLLLGIFIINQKASPFLEYAPAYTSQFNKVKYAYQMFKEGDSDHGLFTLFSGRNSFVATADTMISNEFSVNNHLLGIGYANINTAMGKYQPQHPGITEIDPVDMYMASGGVLVSFYYLLWFIFIVWLGFQIRRAPFFGYVFFLNLFLVAASVTSGHIIYSGLNGPFWGILNGTALAIYGWKHPNTRYNVVILSGMGKGGVRTWVETISLYMKSKLSKRFSVIRTHAEVHQNFLNIFVFAVALFKIGFYATRHIGQTNIYHINVEQGGSFIRAALAVSLAGLFHNSHIVLHIHGARFFEYIEKLKKSRKGKIVFYMLFKNTRVKSVISLTPSGKSALASALDEWRIIPSFDHFVLANPIDYDAIKITRPKNYYSGGTLELVNIARYVEQKNQISLLEAVNKLVSKGVTNVHLNLIGDGELRPMFESYIRKNSLEKYISLTGWVNLEEKKRYLEAADIMVLPSLFESFGIVVLEAYANKLPVIASNTGGLADLVIESLNGTKIDPTNVDQIATAIFNYIIKPKLIQTQGETNFKKSREFDLSQIGKQLNDIYERSTFRATPKLLLIASAGGHLNQLMMLKPWWGKYRRVFVAYNKIDGRTLLKDEYHVLSRYTSIRNPFHVFGTAWLAYKIIREYRPDLIFSTGEGICVPFFYIGKLLFGTKTVLLDSLSKAHPSLSAILSYYILDNLLTQWPDVARKWKRFVYKGRVI